MGVATGEVKGTFSCETGACAIVGIEPALTIPVTVQESVFLDSKRYELWNKLYEFEDAGLLRRHFQGVRSCLSTQEIENNRIELLIRGLTFQICSTSRWIGYENGLEDRGKLGNVCERNLWR